MQKRKEKNMASQLKRNLKRKNRIFFDLSDSELEQLNERLKNYPTTNRSAFIRHAILNTYIIVNDDTNLRELVYEVNRIGNNINQLTHLANQTHAINHEQLIQMQEQVKEIRGLVFHTLMKHNEKRE